LSLFQIYTIVTASVSCFAGNTDKLPTFGIGALVAFWAGTTALGIVTLVTLGAVATTLRIAIFARVEAHAPTIVRRILNIALVAVSNYGLAGRTLSAYILFDPLAGFR